MTLAPYPDLTTDLVPRSAEHDHLPEPPDDVEKYLYLGSQHRWFIALRTLAATSAAISLMLFAKGMPVLWLFYIGLSVFVAYMYLSHYTTTRPRRVQRAEHDFRVRKWQPAAFPSVDVFLPSAGEELAVLANTYRAVAALDYPGKVSVLVLDDADRWEVRRLAERFGFRYEVRPDRGHMKKAGNLKHGFSVSDGDVIAIFDADFVPRPDFLNELMPYLDDPAVAIVQSPQFFDTHRGLPWLQRSAGAVQESFYRWAQPSRDALGAPICVGTCALYRRSALRESGGFAQIGHSEDVHTGVNLLKVGYRTVYIPVVLAKGLCPDRMAPFISQQYRWCAGSMSLLVDPEFHDAPLSYRQRMCFFTGFGYYISTAIGVVLLSLPTIIMLWVLPERVHLSNFFWVLPTLGLYPFIALMHKSSWSPSCLRVYTISSFSHALAIWHVLKGRPAEWVPTGENRRSSMTSTVTRLMIGWLLLTESLMTAGIVHFLASGRSIVDVGPVVFYALMNAYICLPICWAAWRSSTLRDLRLRVPQIKGLPVRTALDPVAVAD